MENKVESGSIKRCFSQRRFQGLGPREERANAMKETQLPVAEAHRTGNGLGVSN